MPRGVPTLGSGSTMKLDSATEELLHAPEPKLIGTIPDQTLNPEPKPTTWKSDTGETVSMVDEVDRQQLDPPAPWEVWGERDDTDARAFVDIPDRYVLRWMNPKLITHRGMGYWEIVPAKGHKDVKVKNRMMIAPDNTIRKGGKDGMILTWMLRSWWDKRVAIKHQQNDKKTQASIDRHREVTERLRRGALGPYITADGPGRHPTHTTLDGRSARD